MHSVFDDEDLFDLEELDEFDQIAGMPMYGAAPPRGTCGMPMRDGSRLYTLKPGDSPYGVARRIYAKSAKRYKTELEPLKAFRWRFRSINKGIRFWPGRVVKIPPIRSIRRDLYGKFKGFRKETPVC